MKKPYVIPLFQILNLFSHLFEFSFNHYNTINYVKIICLGGGGIDFPVDFLKKEVKFLTFRAIRTQNLTELIQMTSQTDNLFCKIVFFPRRRRFP